MPNTSKEPTPVIDKKLKTFKYYQNKAIDFSKKNRLLKYPKSASSIEFEMGLEECEQFFGSLTELKIELPHKEIIKQDEEDENDILFGAKKDNQFPLPKTNITGKKLITQLDKLRLKAKNNFDSHGLHTLFLAVGEIKWKEELAGRGSSEAVPSYDYAAPLLLIPVEILVQKIPHKGSVIRLNDELYDIQINPVLKLFIQQELELQLPTLPEDFSNFVWQEIPKLLNKFEKVLEERGLDTTTTTKVRLGQFTFHGQQIYEDLIRNEDAILENDFIASLCGDSQIIQTTDTVKADDEDCVDNFLTEEEDYTILDADESQLRSIRSVLEGKHMVIHGPPGTGKSQTIANLITNLLARGKRVLFVCEKKVALEVVFNRLKTKDADVSDLCLPLFEYTTDKKLFAKSIIESRDRVINAVRRTSTAAINDKLAKRKERIDTLKEYADALLSVWEPINKSVYWMHGELARVLPNTENIVFPWAGKHPETIDLNAYERINQILIDLSGNSVLIFDTENHWKSLKQTSFSPDYSGRLFGKLEELRHVVASFPQLNGTVFGNPGNISEVKRILSLANNNAAKELLKNRLIISEVFDITSLQEELDFSEKIRQILTRYDEVAGEENKYKVPLKWETSSFEYSLIAKDCDLEKVISAKTEVFLLDEKVQLLEKSLHNNRHAKDILNLNGEAVKKYKNLFDTDPIVQKIKGWEARTSLYDAQNALKGVKTVNEQLVSSQQVLSEWSVPVNELDPKLIWQIEESFSKIYQSTFDSLSPNALKNYKELLSLDPIVQKIKGWDTKTVLQEAHGALVAIKNVYKHLMNAQDVLNAWGVFSIEDIDTHTAFEIEERFSKKYANPFRSFYKTYKSDRIFIVNQCSIKRPDDFGEYRQVIFAISNKIRVQSKFEQILKDFAGKYCDGASVSSASLNLLLENISKIIGYFEFTGIDQLSTEVKVLVASASSNESKKVIALYEGLLKENQLAEGNAISPVSFDDFLKFYSSYSNDISVLVSWCSVHRPQCFADYKNIVFAAADTLRLQTKFEKIMGEFAEKYATDPIVKKVSLDALYESISKILNYLEAANIDRLTTEIKTLVSAADCFDSFKQAIAFYEELSSQKEFLNGVTNQDILNDTVSLSDFLRYAKDIIKECKSAILTYERSIPLLSNTPVTLEALGGDVKILNKLNALCGEISACNPKKYVGLENCIDLIGAQDGILHQQKQVKAVLEILGGNVLSKNDFYANLQALYGEIEIWDKWYLKYQEVNKALGSLMNNEGALGTFETIGMSVFSSYIDNMIVDKDGLEKWIKYQRIKSQLEEYGMEWFITKIIDVVLHRPIFQISLPYLF